MTKYQSIKIAALVFTMITFLTGCNHGATLQTYYVDNELEPGFTSLDIPTSFLNLEETNLSQEQLQAYESIDKLNMLAFVVDDSNKEQFASEVVNVQAILKDPKYEELIRGGNSRDGKFAVKYLGNPDSLKELVLFGYRNEQGFAIIRVLGNDMNANHILKLVSAIQQTDFNDDQISQFLSFLK